MLDLAADIMASDELTETVNVDGAEVVASIERGFDVRRWGGGDLPEKLGRQAGNWALIQVAQTAVRQMRSGLEVRSAAGEVWRIVGWYLECGLWTAIGCGELRAAR